MSAYTYIYLIIRGHDYVPIAAFTRKYQACHMLTRVNDNPAGYGIDLRDLSVVCMRAGSDCPDRTITYTAKEFLELT